MIYLLQEEDTWLYFNSYAIRLGLNNIIFIVGSDPSFYNKVSSSKKLAKILLSGDLCQNGFASNK